MSLPGFNVIATGHDASGNPIFCEPPEPKVATAGRSVVVYSGNVSLSLANDEDLKVHAENKNILPVPGGFTLMLLNVGPESAGKMHRTASVDMGVIVSGEIVFELEGGESRTLKQGDVLLQRGAMHVFRNESKTENCRMVYFVLPATGVEAEYR